MKILIICSGKAAMIPKKNYNSADFDETFRNLPDCDIEMTKSKRISTSRRPVYVSSGKVARQTAELLFTDAEIIEEKSLNEVPIRAYKDTEEELPLWRWMLMASLQRFFGNSRQLETKSQSKARAKTA